MILLLLNACGPSGPDYGAYGPLIKNLRGALATNPCEEKSAESLATTLQKAGHVEEAIPVVEAFVANCPASQEFEDFQLSFGRDAKQWALALKVADKRVADRPSEAALRSSRADLREQAGDLEGALHDYRQATLVREREARAEALKDLALAQKRAGKPCESWQAWNIVAHTSRKLKGEAELAARDMLADPACAGLKTEGEASVTRGELNGWWTFPVTLDGKAFSLGGDTSSLVTVVSQEAADRAGLTATGEPYYLKSFQGVVAGPMTRVAEMKIGDFAIREVDVVILPSVPDGLEGMIGADVLARVGLEEVKGTKWKVAAR